MDLVVRIAIYFLVLLGAFRIFGRRELSRLAPFELVMLLLIPEIISASIVAGDASMTGGLSTATSKPRRPRSSFSGRH